jgi:hypothetical protein
LFNKSDLTNWTSLTGCRWFKSKHPTQPVLAFAGVEGNNIHLWIKKVKLRGVQAGWDMTTLLAQALAVLEGAAALWLHTAAPEVMFHFEQFEEELGRVFVPFMWVELFKEYLNCAQAKGKNVWPFYFWLLLLQKRAGLTDVDLLALQFCEGLKAEV